MSRTDWQGTAVEYRRATPGSAALHDRSRRSIPGGSTRTSSFFEPYPLYLERGSGSRTWDVDGTSRIDFDGNYSALVHGQCFPPIVKALARQSAAAHSFAAPTRHEVVLAEMIKERLPSIELVRFTSTGTEAAVMAMRAARAFNGREKVAKFVGAYHGSSEFASVNTPWLQGASEDAETISSRPDGPGVPRSTVEAVVPLPYNDIDGVRRMLARHDGEVAAVIVEPVLGAGGLIPPEAGFLPLLREVTAERGILLVFDEVITFRLSYGGAQGLFGVRPDLTTLGKVIGGGLPAGAVGGRSDVMSVFDVRRPGGIRHSGTYNANPMTAAAGIACLEALTPACFTRMAELAAGLVERSRALLSERGVPATLSWAESMFNLQALPRPARRHREIVGQDRELLRTIHLGLINAGVQVTPTGLGCVSTVMTPAEVDAFVDALRFVVDRYLA